MDSKWTLESVLYLIKLWKSKDGLYNPKNVHYHNRRERAASLESIAERLQALIPTITALEVKTKINYLRSQYGRELLKIRDSQMVGVGTGEVYVPTAYWFEHLRFLREFVSVRKMKASLFYTADDNSLSEIDDPLQSSKRSMYDDSSLSEIDEPTSPKVIKLEQRSSPAYSSENILTTSSTIIKDEQKSSACDNENILTVDKDYILKLSVTEKPTTPELEVENSFTNFFRANIREVKDKNLQDELMSKIMLLIFEYKRKQRELENF